MVSENQVYLRDGWWAVLFAGLTLSLMILAINILTSGSRGRRAQHARSLRQAWSFKRLVGGRT